MPDKPGATKKGWQTSGWRSLNIQMKIGLGTPGEVYGCYARSLVDREMEAGNGTSKCD